MGMMKYSPIHDEAKKPICPHCERAIDEMSYFEQEGTVKMKVARLFVCPHCLKILGTGMVGM